jgi:hypothetical protein
MWPHVGMHTYRVKHHEYTAAIGCSMATAVLPHCATEPPPTSETRKKARSGAPGGRGRQIGGGTAGTKGRSKMLHATMQRAVRDFEHAQLRHTSPRLPLRPRLLILGKPSLFAQGL